MTRYTVKALESDIENINGTLESIGYRLRLKVGQRNGCTAIDEVLPNSSATERNIEAGTPRNCRAAAYEYLSNAYSRMRRTDDYAIERYHTSHPETTPNQE